jgi:hypothetical protein
MKGSIRQPFRIPKYQKMAATIAMTTTTTARTTYATATFYSCNGADARSMLTNSLRQATSGPRPI